MAIWFVTLYTNKGCYHVTTFLPHLFQIKRLNSQAESCHNFLLCWVLVLVHKTRLEKKNPVICVENLGNAWLHTKYRVLPIQIRNIDGNGNVNNQLLPLQGVESWSIDQEPLELLNVSLYLH